MISAAGFAEGSMASRPSVAAEAIGSASKVARSKNWRSADCSRLSYNAPTGLESIEVRTIQNADVRIVIENES
ncbi:hypothetical protein D3C83_204210 [compost metagenome]